MAKYLKLGEAARNGGSFSDAVTETNISGEAVVKVKDSILRMKHLRARIQAGHIVPATEAEYNAHQAKVDDLTVKAQDDLKRKKLGAAPRQDEDTDDIDELAADLVLDDTKNNDEEDEDDDDEDEEDDAPSRTKASMINDLMGSSVLKESKKKDLSTLSLDKLMKLHDKTILGK